jgi:hypothetical protein
MKNKICTLNCKLKLVSLNIDSFVALALNVKETLATNDIKSSCEFSTTPITYVDVDGKPETVGGSSIARFGIVDKDYDIDIVIKHIDDAMLFIVVDNIANDQLMTKYIDDVDVGLDGNFENTVDNAITKVLNIVNS